MGGCHYQLGASRGRSRQWPDPCVWVVAPSRSGQLSAHTSTLSLSTSTMKKGPRAPSPTNTSFSGISSYRTDSYKPLRDKSSISSPPLDPLFVARIHYDELSKYLVSYLAKGFLLSLSPLVLSYPLRSPRTRQLSLDCTTETHKAHSSAIPRTLHRCLR